MPLGGAWCDLFVGNQCLSRQNDPLRSPSWSIPIFRLACEPVTPSLIFRQVQHQALPSILIHTCRGQCHLSTVALISMLLCLFPPSSYLSSATHRGVATCSVPATGFIFVSTAVGRKGVGADTHYRWPALSTSKSTRQSRIGSSSMVNPDD
jgi:hypothetical protein